MRFQSVMPDLSNSEFLKKNFDNKESFQSFLPNLKITPDYKSELSLTSPTMSDSGNSSDHFSDEVHHHNVHISNHHLKVERRHKNFQVKKKTEVKSYVYSSNDP